MMNDGEPYDSQLNGEALIVGDKNDLDFPNGDQKLKWRSLEHRGVTFFPGYESHGVKLLFKVSKHKRELTYFVQGKEVDLKPEVEEICNWWAQIDGSEFGEKENVKKNFIECFLALFDSSMGATNFEDFQYKCNSERLKQSKSRLRINANGERH